MSRQVIRVLPNGDIQFIDKPGLAALKEEGVATRRRASHVEPASRPLRVAFHLLRRAFGEDGAVAAFTRWWPCYWRVNMALSNGGVLMGLYRHRQDAINAEVLWLQSNNLGSPVAPPATPGSASGASAS